MNQWTECSTLLFALPPFLKCSCPLRLATALHLWAAGPCRPLQGPAAACAADAAACPAGSEGAEKESEEKVDAAEQPPSVKQGASEPPAKQPSLEKQDASEKQRRGFGGSRCLTTNVCEDPSFKKHLKP